MMTNAVIVEHTLGVAQNNVPFVILTFKYVQDNQFKTAQTTPISLIQKGETLNNSGAAEILTYLMIIAGIKTWEKIIGQAVRININEEGLITNVYHATEDLYIKIIPEEQPVSEATEGENKDEVAEENSEVDSSQN